MSSDNTRLELDGYNENLAIAFEYNGKQHYERVPQWQTEEEFKRLQKTDKEKIELCKNKTIHLIVIPYTVKYNDLYTYIYSKCIKLPNNTPLTIDYKVLEIKGFNADKIEQINKFLLEKYGGGKVLSENYVDNRTHLELECKRGHKLEQSFDSIRIGSFL